MSSNLEGSTLTLCQGDMESQAEPFVYKESFSNILPPKSNEILKVIVWTIIDGQLIAKNIVSTYTSQKVECFVDMRYTENGNTRYAF